MRRVSCAFAACLFVVALLGLGGCRTPEPDSGADELPWNAPAPWEGRILGVPY